MRDTIAIIEAPQTEGSAVVGNLNSIAECSDEEEEESDEDIEPIPAMMVTVPETFHTGLADAVATSKPAAPIVLIAPKGDFIDWTAAVRTEVKALARTASSSRRGIIKVIMLDLDDEYNSIEVGWTTYAMHSRVLQDSLVQSCVTECLAVV